MSERMTLAPNCRVELDPEVAAALGVTAEDIAKMTLGQFVVLCIDKGFDAPAVSMPKAPPERAGIVRVVMERDAEHQGPK